MRRERTVRGTKTVEVAYFVTSLSRERADAARLLKLIRGRWGAIENGLHDVRDEVLGEDRSTISAFRPCKIWRRCETPP